MYQNEFIQAIATPECRENFNKIACTSSAAMIAASVKH